MTQAQQTHSGTSTFMPAAVAALVLAAALAIGIVMNGVPTPNIGNGADRISTDGAVLQSGRDWEAQRRQQSGETYKTFDEKVTEARGW